MKKKILAFFACLTCSIFIVSPVGAFGAGLDWVEILVDTAFSELLRESYDATTGSADKNGGINFVYSSFIKKMQEFMITHPTVTGEDDNKELSFTVPTYQIITGKMNLTGSFADFVNDEPTNIRSNSTIIEATILITDSSVEIDSLKPVTSSDDGVSLYPNAVNYTITHNDGSISRYVAVFRTNMFSKFSVVNDHIGIASTNYDIYAYQPYSLRIPLVSNSYLYGMRFNVMTENTIEANINSLCLPNNTNYHGEYLLGVSEWGQSSNGVYDDYVSDLNLLTGRIYVKFAKKDGASGGATLSRYFYPLNYLKVGFYITNDNTSENTVNNSWTTANTQNYYIDNYYDGGTVINNNNKDTEFNGGLLPLFDIDPDLPLADIIDLLTDLLPDVNARLQPTLDVSIDDLFDRLFDFYNKMPAIDMNWDPTLDSENYWEVELPSPPDDGGGGGGSVWVPPEYKPVNTAPFIPATYPTIPTGTLPVNYAQGMGSVLQDGWDIFYELDLLTVICPLVVIVLLWRITGKN